jgi:uncharacterized protein
MKTKRARVDITPADHVTALIYPADENRLGVSLVLAHGAGANQTSDFMVHFAQGLARRGVDAITFNFVYTEAGKRLPDRNDKLESCYLKMIEAFHGGELGGAGKRARLVIGGKSMGGRIASQVAAKVPEGIAGLVFLGYPLHPPGKPEQLRSRHLPDIRAPMLFVQGARDAFGTPAELQPILKDLRASAELAVVENGDHSFKVPKRFGPPQEQVYASVMDTTVQWIEQAIAKPS